VVNVADAVNVPRLDLDDDRLSIPQHEREG